jgi:hypothetical protein
LALSRGARAAGTAGVVLCGRAAALYLTFVPATPAIRAVLAARPDVAGVGQQYGVREGRSSPISHASRCSEGALAPHGLAALIMLLNVLRCLPGSVIPCVCGGRQASGNDPQRGSGTRSVSISNHLRASFTLRAKSAPVCLPANERHELYRR